VTGGTVLAFAVGILPAVLTPGVSLTLAVTRSLAGQQRSATWVVVGTATGIYCHCLLAVAGLSALVLRSAEAFTALRIVGGGYLIVTGALTLKSGRGGAVAAGAPRRLPWSGFHPYGQALLGNVLNPKAALLYLVVAPAVLTPRSFAPGSMLVLASTHVVIMAMWISLWALLARHGRRTLDVARLRRPLDQVGGCLLVGLGLRTMATSR
jgi:threonine/homoserine/homoserine lactone efflux protein